MIPSVGGTIKTNNYVAFRGNEITNTVQEYNDKKNHAIEATVGAGGAAVISRGSYVLNGASKIVTESRTIVNPTKAVDKQMVIKFLEKIFGKSKILSKVCAPIAGFFGGIFAVATCITNGANVFTTGAKITKIEKQ